MKALGIFLVIAGIFMFIFPKITFTQKEKVADIGPLEINKEDKKTVDWPSYAGGIAAIAGIVVLVAANKKNA